MRARSLSFLAILVLGACTAPGGPYPSLQPRAGEAIDPRVAVNRPMNDRPVGAQLAQRLAELLAQARSGDGSFQGAVDRAERLAASAGAAQSESWTIAQEALSAAAAARGPTTLALGDIDALTADALQRQGGISPNDFAAIRSAGAEIGAMDQRQARRIKAIQQRLGS